MRGAKLLRFATALRPRPDGYAFPRQDGRCVQGDAFFRGGTCVVELRRLLQELGKRCQHLARPGRHPFGSLLNSSPKGWVIAPDLGEALPLLDLARMKRKSRNLRNIHAGVRCRHILVPSWCRQMAAGRPARHFAVIIVPEPNACTGLSREPDEPNVPGAGTRTGLPRRGCKIELGGLARSLAHNFF